MNYDAFLQKYPSGTVVNDYGGECVALVAHYCLDNGKPIAYANAKDWWNHPALTGSFDFITNVPTDLNQVPSRGDVIIWNGNLAGSGGYGHIAIYDGKVSPGIFRSYDNNWGGRYFHFVTHNYNNVIGWMRPKAVAPPTGGIILNGDQVNKLYVLGFHRQGDSGGIKNYTGKSLDAALNDMLSSQEWLTQNHQLLVTLPQIQQQLAVIQDQSNRQNEAITKLTSDLDLSKAQEAKLTTQIADANAEIQKAHDTIKDLQEKATQDTALLDDTSNIITRLIKRIFNRS